MSGAQALVRSLAREGVEVVFALPGVQIMDAFDAIYDQPGIRLVLVRHEQSVTYMADGYAKTTGKPGVGLVASPGALNATTGLGIAYSTSSRVLLICGQTQTYNLGKNRGAWHEIGPPLEVFRQLTKWSDRATSVGEIPGMVHKAMREFSTGRPRPVEIDVPWDVMSAFADLELLEMEVFPKEAPETSKIKEAAKLLANARRPLIWAGGGCREADLSTELLELAQAINAPVITTAQGKGAVPEDDPLSLGANYYPAPGYGPGHIALPRTDLILAVGSRLHFPPNLSWDPQPHQKVIQIDADAEELGRNLPLSVGITADGKLGLQALLNELGGKTRASQWSKGELSAIRQQCYQEMQATAPIGTQIVETLRREMDDDAILVSGSTLIGYWSHLAFPVAKPRSYVTCGDYGTVGYAFPTALGAKVGNPHRQVVATSGDGGFGYAPGELSTAVQEGINAVTIVFNNGVFGDYRPTGTSNGTRLHNPDFAQLAEAYGALGMKLADHHELGEALRSALRANRPVIVEVPIPNFPSPF